MRVQVILSEQEAARFSSQAAREAKSLSGWLREAGRKALATSRQQAALTDAVALKRFLQACREREKGAEPDWQDHKGRILEGLQAGGRP